MQVDMIFLNLLLYPRRPLGGARIVLRAIEHETIHHSGYCLGRCTTAINLLLLFARPRVQEIRRLSYRIVLKYSMGSVVDVD